MTRLVFGMNMSLDGFVEPHEPFAPDPVLFTWFIEQTRRAAGSLYGRGLYEVMRYWDGDAWQQDTTGRSGLQDFAEAWRAMPKWVASRTLRSVGPNATLLGDDLEAEVRRLKAEHDGDIEVGGPRLAASLAGLGLIDAWHVFLHPVVLGSGTPYFAAPPPRLRLSGTERIGENIVKLTYVPV